MRVNNLVSIIMPTYNSVKYVLESVSSVIDQTYINWELIIVDDASNDSTVLSLKEISRQDERIKIIYLDVNSGSAVSRNTGIKLAKGDFIAFLDSDDIWLPNKLEKQINFMLLNNVDFSYSAYQKSNEEGDVLGDVNVPAKVSYEDLLKVCSIGCLTAIYDVRRLGKIYMPLIRRRQDLGLWLRILRKVPFAYGLNEPLAQYRVRSDSISANKKIAAQYTWRLYRDIEELSLMRSLYFFSHYAVNGVLRSKLPRFARFIGRL